MTTHSTFFAPRFSLFCLLFLAYLMAKANNNTNQFVFPNPYQTSFEEAYKQYPTIPPGVLQAIAYSNTRMRHLTPQNTRNACSDMPRYYGVMGLIADGKNWFRDNLQQVANLSGYKPDDLYRQPEKQIMAYAAAFSALQQQLGCTSTQIEHNLPVLYALSELPESPNPQADFALNSQIYQILYWLNHPQFRATYGLNNANAPQINIAAILGPTVYAQVTAASQQITIPANLPTPTTPNSGPAKNPEACTMPDGPAQYSSALWVATTNYSSYAIEPFTVAIHTMQGTYAGSISWFQNPDAQASAHYCVRAFDGQITQMACHTARAWHVTSQNSNAVGIEHEGFVEDGNAWYTNAMYQSSAQLTQFIAADRSINTLQTYDGPPTDGLKVLSNECHKIKGHQHFPDQTHIDPGPFWDWERYYLLINTLPKPQANYQSQTDTIYDSGGATNNYQNEERKVWRISPTDAKTVTLTFKTFDIEKDWDFLWIYDGPDNTGALIGKYSGNTLPGVITAYSGKMCLEFRSDCATTKSGWMAVYNASYSDAACPAPNNLAVTNLYPFGATLTWSESDKTTGYNLRYKRDFATDWTNINTDNTSLALTGLIHNAVYQWQVRSQCGTDQSGWVGSTFTTPAAGSTQTSPGSYTTTACEGIFTDSGGTEAVYSHYEDWTYTIAPAGATGLTLQFTNFETENNFDVLWIYDGLNTNAPLLGKFSGTSSPGTINATGGALTLRFTSDKATYKNGWQANWQCSGLPQCLPTTLINPLPTWITNDCEATFVDSDCAVGYTGFYAPLDYSSEWRANGKAGFFNDEFGKAQLHADWVTTLGTWATNNGVLQQTNQTLTNTNLYAALNQTQDGTWLYEFDGKISGTNADRRAGLHFFCSDPAATNRGDSYFVWLRADGNKAQIYRTKDNVFTLEAEADALIEVNTWYNYRITYHPASGKINFYQNGNLLVTFTDTNAYKSGQGLSLRSGNSLFEVDNLRVYRSRLGSATTITVGSDPTDMVRYQSPNPGTFGLKLYSIILADNGLWSNTTYQATKIDWTPPVVNWVNDGNDKDEAVTFDKTQLTANWHVGYDAQSGVAAWYIAVGTAPATDDI
ncbi:MAG: N-acetylmuramoyl-L-alanine amidase, partial [Chitinophagales bacterium]|nr:N-acetylmuramoyl-L-alanine amidase [Chitinophagales bacterium]